MSRIPTSNSLRQFTYQRRNWRFLDSFGPQRVSALCQAVTHRVIRWFGKRINIRKTAQNWSQITIIDVGYLAN